MKQIIGLLSILMLCLPLSACKNAGTTNNAEIDYGSSTVFSDTEIESAVDAVLAKFQDFEGCDLRRIWYDENRSNAEIESYLTSGRGKVNGVAQENVIVLFSDFYVDSSGGDGGFNPDSTYTDWTWVLIRDSENDAWKVDDWGY
jgi:hypothetical protein